MIHFCVLLHKQLTLRHYCYVTHTRIHKTWTNRRNVTGMRGDRNKTNLKSLIVVIVCRGACLTQSCIAWETFDRWGGGVGFSSAQIPSWTGPIFCEEFTFEKKKKKYVCFAKTNQNMFTFHSWWLHFKHLFAHIIQQGDSFLCTSPQTIHINHYSYVTRPVKSDTLFEVLENLQRIGSPFCLFVYLFVLILHFSRYYLLATTALINYFTKYKDCV